MGGSDLALEGVSGGSKKSLDLAHIPMLASLSARCLVWNERNKWKYGSI